MSEEEIDKLAVEYSKETLGCGYREGMLPATSLEVGFIDGYKYSLNVQGGAVSEEKLSEIFANHADNTPYLNFTAFKEAVKELLNR